MARAPHRTDANLALHAEREARLAQALRDNLRRRNEQRRHQEAARAPAQAAEPPAADTPAESQAETPAA
jgi:hypothetical protein